MEYLLVNHAQATNIIKELQDLRNTKQRPDEEET